MEPIRGPCCRPGFRGGALGPRAPFTGSRPLRFRWTSQRARPLAAPRGVDLGDDAHWLRRAQRRRISKLRGSVGSQPSCSIGAYLMYSLRQRRAAHSGSMRTPIRRRGNNVPEGRDFKTKPTAGTADELALKLPILEAEILGLRQLLAEVRANHDELRQEIDDLRHDRDHSQKLTE